MIRADLKRDIEQILFVDRASNPSYTANQILTLFDQSNKDLLDRVEKDVIGADDNTDIASLGAERDAKIRAHPIMQRKTYRNELRFEQRATLKDIRREICK